MIPVLSAVAVVAVLATTACELQLAGAVDDARAAVGRAGLPIAPVLTDEATAHSRSMCAAGHVSASADPVATYDGETAAAVHELVGSAALDRAVADPVERNTAATDAIWQGMQGDPALVDESWTDQGVGEVTCGDGNLYVTLVLRRAPTMPASGLYSSAQYTVSSTPTASAIQYATAVDAVGATVALLLDLYLPPALAPSPRPLVVLIHGGAFAGGSRSDYGGVAAAWTARGYAVAAIDYRLDPRLNGPHDQSMQLTAAANAILDAQESVRFLKAHASAYAIDPTRVLAVGDSAGGAIAIGLSAVPDTHPSTPYGAFTPSVAAAVSTGAYLTPAFDSGLLHLTGVEPPILMFHYETDVASDTGEYAFRTCAVYRAAGDTCDFVLQPGEGHTTNLTPGGQWWSNEIGPFVFHWLRLPT